MTPEDLASAFSKFVNGASMDEQKQLGQLLTQDHRTLVQAKFAIMLHFIKALANHYKDDNYDMRNEYACKTSASIMKVIEHSGCPFI
jgi:arginine repressor